MSKEINTPQNNSEEVDLGQLFKLIGNFFDRLFKFIGTIFNKFFIAFVWCVFFIKKHIIKFIIAGIVGFGYGFFKEYNSEPTYKSSMIIRQNYPTGENLYNTIYYYNKLISQQDYNTLASILLVDSVYVSSITGIEVEAVIGENQRLIEFNKYTKKLDSVLVANINYKDYLDNVKDYIYELQQLTIVSRVNDNFDKIFDGIINNLNENKYFKREQDKDIKQLINRELAIKSALTQSDSLQKIYKKVLENTIDPNKSTQTSITIEAADEKNKTKEFDLYKNDIELRRELVIIEREKENKESIVELLTSNPAKGYEDNSIEVLNVTLDPKTFYTLALPFILFIVLISFRFIAFLETYKEKM